jgi:hypothetical protein
MIRKKKTKKRMEKQVKRPAPELKLSLGDFSDLYPIEGDELVIPTDEHTSIRLALRRGGELGLFQLEVREYKDTEKFKGYTRQGITIPCGQLEDFSDAVLRIFDYCDEGGHLDD